MYKGLKDVPGLNPSFLFYLPIINFTLLFLPSFFPISLFLLVSLLPSPFLPLLPLPPFPFFSPISSLSHFFSLSPLSPLSSLSPFLSPLSISPLSPFLSPLSISPSLSHWHSLPLPPSLLGWYTENLQVFPMIYQTTCGRTISVLSTWRCEHSTDTAACMYMYTCGDILFLHSVFCISKLFPDSAGNAS